MKRLLLFCTCLLFVTFPGFAGEPPHLERGHNQIEIEGLQSIDISPVFDLPTGNTVDMVCQEDGAIFHVGLKPVLTLPDIIHAAVSEDQEMATLLLDLTEDGGNRRREFTLVNVGKRLAFIVNGVLIKTPIIRVPITGGILAIDPVDKVFAEKLVELINNRIK